MGRSKEARALKLSARQQQRAERQAKHHPKFDEERNSAPALTALNEKQQDYLHKLQTCNIIIAKGIFGTGKTYLASAHAADLLRRNDLDKIIVARPYVQTGKTSGFKPGTSLEKLFPYVRNMLDTIRKRMGDGAYYNALKDGLNGRIEVQELESIRGRSFDEKSFLLIDEAQQSTPEEMLSIITRISDNCTLVVMGDASQKDIHGISGLEWVEDFLQRHNIAGVGVVNFDNVDDDIVRGGVVRDIAKGLMADRGKGLYTPMAS
ncbi:PhoH-like protein [Salmonella phage NINP13076]|uniref:PhoH-like protein n=1 Tax=Salmonella phage SalP219 TaxID=3158864 RepID=A0AAU7PHT0_9CAUD|nr:PhoH-like protein [Salmonella phage NINP13076]